MHGDPLQEWPYVPRSEREVKDEDVFASLDPSWPGLERTLAAYRERRLDDAKRELLAYFRQREKPRWHFDGRGAAEAAFRPETLLSVGGSVAHSAEGHIADVMADADRLVRGQFLGGVLHDLGERWDRFPLFDLNGEDDKPLRVTANRFVRMNFIKPLVVAYYRTRKSVYAETLAAILKAFTEKLLEEHPYVPDPVESAEAYTIQYSRSPFRSNMSVAQSALNIVDLMHTGLFDSQWLPTRLSFRLFRYAWYVMGYHRTYDRNRYRHYNHHLFERGIVPIAFSVMFPEFPHLRPLLERGREVVDAHFEHDYHESGGYDEHSMAYTCKTTLAEFLFPAVRLFELNGLGEASEAWRRKLGHVCTYYSGLAMPDGRFPDVGDAGGGAARWLLEQGADRFGSRSAQAVLSALGLAGQERAGKAEAHAGTEAESETETESETEMKSEAETESEADREVETETGVEADAEADVEADVKADEETVAGHRGEVEPALPPLAMSDPPTGYLWARESWASDSSFMLMCNKIFTRHCAHNHVDMLSLILAVRGETLIGEPLARTLYKYVSNASALDDYLRGLGSHNTVLVHGQAVTKPMLQRQQRMDSQTVHTEAFDCKDDAVYVRASHRADLNGSHTREVLFVHGAGWLIADTVGMTGAGNGQPHVQRWHLEHGVTAERVCAEGEETGDCADFAGRSGRTDPKTGEKGRAERETQAYGSDEAEHVSQAERAGTTGEAGCMIETGREDRTGRASKVGQTVDWSDANRAGVGSSALVLRGRSSRLLCVWPEESDIAIRLWKQETVLAIGSVPDYKTAFELPWIVDVSFGPAADGLQCRLPCLFLDVTQTEESLAAILARCRQFLSEHWERLCAGGQPALEGAAFSASMKQVLHPREEAL